MNYYVMAFKKFAQFDGRSSRSEYWYFALFNFLISFAISLITGFTGIKALGGLSALYVLAIIIPSIAISVRRLHDTNRTGWWVLVTFIPFIGGLILLYFAVLPSDEGDNQYGSKPSPSSSEAPVNEPVITQQTSVEQAPVQQ